MRNTTITRLPRSIATAFPSAIRGRCVHERDRRFESVSLQRRVGRTSVSGRRRRSIKHHRTVHGSCCFGGSRCETAVQKPCKIKTVAVLRFPRRGSRSSAVGGSGPRCRSPSSYQQQGDHDGGKAAEGRPEGL